MSKEKLLTKPWNNSLTLALGLPTLALGMPTEKAIMFPLRIP